MIAWLFTWEGTDRRIVPANQIIGIISGRRSSSFAFELAEVLYLRNYATAYDMAYLANRKKKAAAFYGKQHTYNGGLLIGKNPFIYVRRVLNLIIKSDNKSQNETVSWKEPPSYHQAPEKNYAIELIDPGQDRTIVRPHRRTLAHDLEQASFWKMVTTSANSS